VRALARFPYLRPELSRIDTHFVSRLYLEGPEGASTLIESEWPAALMIRRVEFDNLLVSLAVRAGAKLVTGVDVVQVHQGDEGVQLVSRDGRRFNSPVVVAADGVHSVVARRVGLNRGWPDTSVALDMMEEAPRSTLRDVDPSTLWVAYGYQPDPPREASRPGAQAAEGYAYIFPKRDHVNVGIGYVLSYYRREMDAAPYELQRSFIEELRRRGLMEGASRRSNFTPFLIPVGGPLTHPGRGRVLLAGDAGGFVNGFTAEGIYYAMVTGDLAARAIVERGAASSGLARYFSRLCQNEVGAELRDSVLIQRYLFANRRRIVRVIQSAQRESLLTRRILEFAVGRTSYRQLRRSMLARSPLLAARLLWARFAS
jgi:flavin-dependent dehydrogenase